MMSMSNSDDTVAVKLIVGTHSPLIMSSVEPKFDNGKDAWFDIDFIDGEVVIQKRQYFLHGSAENWLRGEAFDLPSTYSLEAEDAIEYASEVLSRQNPDRDEIRNIDNRLCSLLSDTDEYLILWRYNLERRGLADATS